MSIKRKKISERLDSRLKRTDLILRLFISIMFIVVLYDSFCFGIPFHYILLYFLGMFIGKLFNYSHNVQLDGETQMLNLRTNWASIVLLLVLIVLRFFLGRPILESAHISRVSDALYLFFIGIYYSKWKILLKQIDAIYYGILGKIENEQKHD